MRKQAKDVWQILRGMQRRMTRANLSLVAAGGAFFAMLSLFPGLAAVITLLGLVSDPMIVEQQIGMLADFMPEQAFVILQNQVTRLITASSGALGWATLISTLAALWSARRGTDALIQALNTVFDAPQRGGVGGNVAALGITLAMIVVVVLALITMVLAPVLLAFLPLGTLAGITVDVTRWLLAVLVVISGIWVLYRFAPNRRMPFIRWLSPGALMAIAVWALASWSFSTYLRNFGSYNEVYGSIGAVVALLMFLYITIFTVLLGATLNAELEPQIPDAPPAPEEGGEAETMQPAAATASMSEP